MLKEYIIKETIQSEELFDKEDLINELDKEIDDVFIDVSMYKSFDGRMLPTLWIKFKNDNKDKYNTYCFVFRLWDGKIDCTHTPLVYLSPFDKSGYNEYNPHLKYMAMRSAEDLVKECGLKKWRNAKFNSTKDIVRKIAPYANECIRLLNAYCGGDVRKLDFPLKGVLEESIKDAIKK